MNTWYLARGAYVLFRACQVLLRAYVRTFRQCLEHIHVVLTVDHAVHILQQAAVLYDLSVSVYVRLGEPLLLVIRGQAVRHHGRHGDPHLRDRTSRAQTKRERRRTKKKHDKSTTNEVEEEYMFWGGLGTVAPRQIKKNKNF